MSWGKVCGSYAFHPKVLAVGNEGAGAHTRMIAYACEHLTSGHIARPVALSIAAEAVLERMVDAELLDRDGDDFVIHDFADYNPSGPELEAKRADIRAKRAEAGRRGAMSRWHRPDKVDGNESGKQDGKADGNGMAPSPSPSPSPIPSPAPRESAPAAPPASARGTRVPGSDAGDEVVDTWGKTHGIDVVHREFQKFIDHWRAQPGAKGLKADWPATWRNWLRRSGEFAPQARIRLPGQQPVDEGAPWLQEQS